MCQDGLHTKNKQASHCNSKKNGCGFGRVRGWRGKESWRQKRGTHEGVREGGEEGGKTVEGASETCHKTIIIGDLSASQ